MPAIDTRQPKKTSEQERTEREVREWFAIACDCISNQDRESLRVAARELAERGVGFTANFLDRGTER
jgi:hypothetical protein